MIPNNYVLSRDKIVQAKTQEQLSEAIAFSVEHSNDFSDLQNNMLRDIVANKQNAIRVSEQYNDIDKENFNPIDIVETTGSQTTVAQEEKPKRTRKVKDNDQSEVIPQSFCNTYRVKRRVNRPIDGVQYSKNEYEVEFESTDQATLLSELDAIEREVIQRLSLYNKDALEAYGKKKYDEGVASVKPVVTQAPVTTKVNTFEYDMSGAVSLDLQYTLARYQRLNSFVLQSFEKFPEVKKLYEEFSLTNPKIEAPNL